MEKKKIEVIVGKPVDGPVDRNKMMVGLPSPPAQGQVAGRGAAWEWVNCPYCGALNYVYVDDDVYLYYECWRCHNVFKV